MVRAILAGAKTQTRRVMKDQVESPGIVQMCRPGLCEIVTERGVKLPGFHCPYGQPGDRLWVREAFCKIPGQTRDWIETDYRATYRHGDRLGDLLGDKKRWTPSIHMPRAASRITLEITGVRVERLQNCSEADAIAEGCSQNHNGYYWGGPHAAGGLKQLASPVAAYRDLWDSINGTGEHAWAANPWVWVVEFKKLEA